MASAKINSEAGADWKDNGVYMLWPAGGALPTKSLEIAVPRLLVNRKVYMGFYVTSWTNLFLDAEWVFELDGKKIFSLPQKANLIAGAPYSGGGATVTFKAVPTNGWNTAGGNGAASPDGIEFYWNGNGSAMLSPWNVKLECDKIRFQVNSSQNNQASAQDTRIALCCYSQNLL